MLLLFVSTTVVGALLAPHAQGPQPSALGDFSVPTAEAGRAIPIVAGTVKIQGGNTVWWGDLKVSPVYPPTSVIGAVATFGASLLSTQVIGYKYFLGCQFVLCQGPVDALIAVEGDKKDLSYTATTILNGNGSEDYIQLDVTSENIFGGTVPGGGGGIAGTLDFYRGLQTSQPNDYLSAKQGRIVFDSSGMGYTFAGVGNGIITLLSGGSASLLETITLTAIGIDTNVLHSTFGKMKFSAVGSVSGTLSNSTANLEGSHALWADAAFSCTRINLTIVTGTTQFAIGDIFTIQTEHSHLAAALRGICYAVFEQLYVGTSNYLKPLAFIVRRCPDPFAQGAGVANISGDANPALLAYELLTDVVYGLAIPGVTVDVASFQAAAVTLADEGLGISMQFDTQASADQLIGEVMRHCDGLIYTDPTTGLWTIVLARGGYDPTTLPLLTVDDVLATPDFSRGSWSETTNLVLIKFTDRAGDFAVGGITAYDAANIAVTGNVRPQTIEFKGLSNSTTAALVAMRCLKTFTYPLAKIKLVCNRTAWQFRPGGLFRLTWVPLGIVTEVFRITRIGYGELTDGKITIDAVEDIFGINSVAFTPPPDSGWVNPIGVPLAPAAQELLELPYHFRQDGIHALAMCARADQTSMSYEVWLDEGAGYFDSTQIFAFCPTGLLAAAYLAATVALDPTGFSLTILDSIDVDELVSVLATDVVNGKNLLLIDQEIMSWQTVTANVDGSFTISGILRGACDTVPADHAASARVFFFSSGSGLTKTPAYVADSTITAKLLPQNAQGEFPIASATAVTLTTRSRGTRPYPPACLQINANTYGTRPSTISGDLTITWKSRNRLTQTVAGPLVAQDAADITGESGQTFDVTVIAADLTVLRTQTGIAVETWTYLATDRISDGHPGAITVQVFSHVGALQSFMPNELVVTMT